MGNGLIYDAYVMLGMKAPNDAQLETAFAQNPEQP
jgi:hypothetical protein